MKSAGTPNQPSVAGARRRPVARPVFPGLRPLLMALLFGAIALFPASARTLAAGPDRLLRDDPNIPWQITADTIQRDLTHNRYSARGNVTIV